MTSILGGALWVSLASAALAAATIIYRDPRSQVHRSVGLFLISAALWCGLINLQNPSASAEFNLWIVRATFIAAICMVVTLFRFCYAFTAPHSRKFLWGVVYLLGYISVIGAVCGAFTPSVTIQNGHIIPERTVLYGFVIVYLLTVIVGAITLLVQMYPETTQKLARKRLRLIIAGLSLGIIAGIATNIVLPNVLGTIEPARYSWVGLIIWTVALTYTIVRHHFLDVRLTVVRSIAYFLSLSSMIVLYFSLAGLATVVMPRIPNTGGVYTLTTISIALVLGVLFQPLKRFFDSLTNKVFYRYNQSPEELFVRLSGQLASTVDLSTLLRQAVGEIANALQAEHATIFVKLRHKTIFIDTKSKQPLSPTSFSDFAKDWTLVAPTFCDELPTGDPARRFASRHGIDIILPLIRRKKLIGYVLVGRRKSGGYSYRHLRLLDTIKDELVIAIQNAESVQEVKELNETLQQKITSATEELRATYEKLKRLDAAKDEFVSMASHQLRTPLTSVKGYISMVLEGDGGKITATQRKLLGEAFTSSERMVHLIADFLNVSRLQTGKFAMDTRPINLAKVVSQEVESLMTTATSRTLKLRYRQPSSFPTLYLDEAKIRQVVMNFIDNAIYYSREHGTIIVSLTSEEGYAVLKVKDDGIGVPEAEKAHLFAKFFRAANARKQRPDGTGVGLFLSKKIIDAHAGTTIFESIENEGSTFGFRLPIKQLAERPDELKDEPDDYRDH